MFSPLEQFLILPLISLGGHIAITNEFIFLGLIFLFSLVLFFCFIQKDNTFYIFSNNWQAGYQLFYELILFTVLKNINDSRNQKFFPVVFNIFLFILFLNLIGLIPNSFTLTSHLIVTFGMSCSIFIGITLICINAHGIKFFSLFLPSGTPTGLAFLLIPIELISYFFKPISLSIRLFANLMAGHTLMHVIAGFGYSFIKCHSFFYFLQFIPVVILLPLFLLDLGVCAIQAFVFCILICIYLNDAVALH
jgi:ATP synthase subunit 6